MRSVWIALKDLRQRLRDRSAIMLGIVAPLGLAFIFSLIIPDVVTDFRVDLGVADASQGAITSPFIAGLAGSGFVTVERYPSREALVAAVDSGDADAGLVVPADFDPRVTSPEAVACDASGCTAATLEVIAHPDRQTSAQITQAIAAQFAGGVTGVRVAVAAAIASGRTDVVAVQAAAASGVPPVTVDDVTARSRQLDINTFFAAGMAIFFLFFTVQFGVASLIEERADGTMPRLLAAPLRSWQIIAGKALASFAVGVVAMAVLIVGTAVLIGASWGDPLGVALLVVAAVLSAIGIMALIATLARTAEQAGNWQAIVAIVLGMLGGTFFPVSQGPAFLARLAALTPHYWFMRGVGDMQAAAGLSDVLPSVLALLAFSAVTVAVAATRVRAMVRP
jgi:ABC-2 type transport system permease protein